MFSEPHFLSDARTVHPRPGRTLLLLQLASLHSGDGDQRIATLVLAYDRAQDSFLPVYQHITGHNNNQEIRYIADGPLRGSIVSAEPTRDAPFAFWITVNKLGPVGGYRRVLRYRSATRYGDGNPLPVIDSEWPNIERRLGMSAAGSFLPLRGAHCPRPHMIGMESWCR